MLDAISHIALIVKDSNRTDHIDASLPAFMSQPDTPM